MIEQTYRSKQFWIVTDNSLQSFRTQPKKLRLQLLGPFAPKRWWKITIKISFLKFYILYFSSCISKAKVVNPNPAGSWFIGLWFIGSGFEEKNVGSGFGRNIKIQNPSRMILIVLNLLDNINWQRLYISIISLSLYINISFFFTLQTYSFILQNIYNML